MHLNKRAQNVTTRAHLCSSVHESAARRHVGLLLRRPHVPHHSFARSSVALHFELGNLMAEVNDTLKGYKVFKEISELVLR